MPYFDRFDVLEAWSCLAHDYGLYGVNARLHKMGYKPRPSLKTENLSDNGEMIYAYWCGVIDELDRKLKMDLWDWHPFRGQPLAH